MLPVVAPVDSPARWRAAAPFGKMGPKGESIVELNERVAALRKAAGLSQEQLAERLDVSRQAVGKWERGEAVPDLEKTVRLARVFGVSVDSLLGLEAPEGKAAGERAAVSAPCPQPEQAAPDFERLARMNHAYWQLRTSAKLLTAAGVLLLCSIGMPFLVQFLDMTLTGEWYNDVGFYVSHGPAPFFIAATLLVAALGGWLHWRGKETLAAPKEE